jgi:hypothetical protein
MDAGKWSLVLAIVALVLIYPVGVLATLTSPRINDWYSTRNRKKLRMRLAFLETRLQISEEECTYSAVEWKIYTAVHEADRRTFAAGHMLYTLVVVGFILGYPNVVSTVHPRPAAKFLAWIIMLNALSSGIMNFLTFKSNNKDWRNERELHTVPGREQLRERIEKLREKDRGGSDQ